MRANGDILPNDRIKNITTSEEIDSAVSLKTILCDKLIEIVGRHDLKQVEVANLIEASPAQVCEIMNKKFERISIDFIFRKTQLLVDGLKKNHIANEEVEVDLTIRPSTEI
ncbi:MAG: hypothetical protein A2622_12715 [Bdellovibrionales bacterium RIFCSPHIGHO2_01_FULL_40_29]|nr:MAG: hypothetical protein A2622_12715 [Bdellovibrionales bacterium RIFCSPHIGHO2_01_FULL_40_29]OFZ33443.1 MAG: hypothetical protein A3D17_14170 [Bdellovibrionales bacterium RIFCSPHIGHO2_02_FULL_40_15]